MATARSASSFVPIDEHARHEHDDDDDGDGDGGDGDTHGGGGGGDDDDAAVGLDLSRDGGESSFASGAGYVASRPSYASTAGTGLSSSAAGGSARPLGLTGFSMRSLAAGSDGGASSFASPSSFAARSTSPSSFAETSSGSPTPLEWGSPSIDGSSSLCSSFPSHGALSSYYQAASSGDEARSRDGVWDQDLVFITSRNGRAPLFRDESGCGGALDAAEILARESSDPAAEQRAAAPQTAAARHRAEREAARAARRRRLEVTARNSSSTANRPVLL